MRRRPDHPRSHRHRELGDAVRRTRFAALGVVEFHPSDLLQKFGFGDGDMLEDLREEHGRRSIARYLVAAVVERLVVPRLDQRVETYTLASMHNPIRARTVDGEEADMDSTLPPRSSRSQSPRSSRQHARSPPSRTRRMRGERGDRHQTARLPRRACRLPDGPGREAHVFIDNPNEIFQQLYNRLQWEGTGVEQRLVPERVSRSRSGARPWLVTNTPFPDSAAFLRAWPATQTSCEAAPSAPTAAASSPPATTRRSGCGTRRPAPGLRTLAGHTDFVRGCAFSPDGSRIVSASVDKTLRVWDAATGAELATLAGHAGSVNELCLQPRRAAASSRPATTRRSGCGTRSPGPSCVPWPVTQAGCEAVPSAPTGAASSRRAQTRRSGCGTRRPGPSCVPWPVTQAL